MTPPQAEGPQVGGSVESPLAHHSLLEGQSRRHSGDGGPAAEDEVLPVPTVIARSQPENPVARLERSVALADGLDLPGEIHAQYGLLGPRQPADQADEEGMGPPPPTVAAADRAGMHLDQALPRPRLGRGHLLDLDDLRRAVAGVDGGFHH